VRKVLLILLCFLLLASSVIAIEIGLNDKGITITLKDSDIDNKVNELSTSINPTSNIEEYINLLPDTDFKLEVTDKHIKENITIKREPSYDKIVFDIDLGIYSYELTENNTILIKDKGVPYALILQPFIVENNQLLDFSFDGSEYVIYLSKVDWEGLSFPVVIDPTFIYIQQITGGSFDRVGTDNAGVSTDNFAQSFTVSRTFIINQVAINITEINGIPDGEFWIAITDDNAGDPSNNLINAFSNLTIANVSQLLVGSINNFTFPGNIQLDTGNIYWLRLHSNQATGGGVNKGYSFGRSTANVYANGTLQRSEDGGAWIDRAVDLQFRISRFIDSDLFNDYEPVVFENQPTSFNLTIGNLTSNATLFYDDVAFYPSLTNNGSHNRFEVNLTTPNSKFNTNVTFYWNYTSIAINTTTDKIDQQIVALRIDNCSNFTIPLFDFYIKDELTQALITSNTSFFFSYTTDFDTTPKQLTVSQFNSNTYKFCKSGEGFNIIGTMSHTVRKEGYETREFDRDDILFNENQTAYLLETSVTASTILFTIVDSSLRKIEGARLNIYRLIDGVQTLIFSANSDFGGQVSTALDQTHIYFFNLTAPGFPLKSFSLKPVLTSYTIKITEAGELLYSNQYEGLRYKIEPNNNKFNISNNFIHFNFTLEGLNLELWGLNFSRNSFECIPASCSNVSTDPNGGVVSVLIKVNHTGRFYTNIFFKKIGDDLVNINSWPNDGVIFETAVRSTVTLFDEIKDNVSPNVLSVIAALISCTLIGLAAMMGITGMALVVIAIAANIFLSLPMIGLINPVFGFFITVMGLAIYSFSFRGQS